MAENAAHNDQNPTDPVNLFALILASVLLVKTLTTEEATNLAALLPYAFAALPYLRR